LSNSDDRLFSLAEGIQIEEVISHVPQIKSNLISGKPIYHISIIKSKYFILIFEERKKS